MYNPNDKEIKDMITKGIRGLTDAEHWSNDKYQTIEDICREIEKHLPIEAAPRC